VSGVPVEFLVVAGLFVGLTIVLLAVAGTCGAVTVLRRSVRHCRISWRSEGWGSPSHKNQEIPVDPPVPGVLETVKGFLLPGPSDQPQLPKHSGQGSDPASASDSTEGAEPDSPD
jgi:hypothetical protein